MNANDQAFRCGRNAVLTRTVQRLRAALKNPQGVTPHDKFRESGSVTVQDRQGPGLALGRCYGNRSPGAGGGPRPQSVTRIECVPCLWGIVGLLDHAEQGDGEGQRNHLFAGKSNEADCAEVPWDRESLRMGASQIAGAASEALDSFIANSHA